MGNGSASDKGDSSEHPHKSSLVFSVPGLQHGRRFSRPPTACHRSCNHASLGQKSGGSKANLLDLAVKGARSSTSAPQAAQHAEFLAQSKQGRCGM